MLLKTIRHNQRLAERRSPIYDKNRYAKALVYVFVAFWAAYLAFIGVSLSFAFKEVRHLEAYDMMNGGLTIFLFIDFLVRFMLPLPSQEIKPYLLLPIPKQQIMNTLLLQTGLKLFNLFWLFLFVPFGFLTVARYFGISGMAGYALGIWLLTVMNAYWSVLARTLIRSHVIWILLPVLLYAGLLVAELATGGGVSSASMWLGDAMIRWNPLAFLSVLAAIVLLWYLNSSVQHKAIYNELARKEDTRVKHVRQFGWLDKFGETGEFMRLEMKLITRNKATSANFKTLTVCIALFAAMLFGMTSDDEQAQSPFMVYFYCVYCFCSYGVAILSRIMAYEGNYLDGIMARKGSLYNLLKGKYYMHCLLLAVPLACLLPSCIWSSLPFAYVMGQFFFTAGITLPMLMCLAIFNDKTAPLTASLWGKGQWNTAYQSVTVAVALFLPILLSKVLPIVVGDAAGNWICLAAGLGGMIMQPVWLKAIYRQIMKRRYHTMESLRNTR